MGNTNFYPPGFAEEVVEHLPHTKNGGSRTVLFRRSRLSPAELNAWCLTGPAASSIVRAYWLGPSGSHAVATSRAALLAALVAAGPPAGGGAVRLQCAPRSLEAWLLEVLPPEFDLQPVGNAWVLNVIEFEPLPLGAAGGVPPSRRPPPMLPRKQREAAEAARVRHYRHCYQAADILYNYPPLLPQRVPDQLSKAAGKLAEALAATGLQLTTGVAVDLGAAPGGWTHVLAQRARHVIAVDPAEMDPRALVPGVVTHLACKGQDAVPRIQELVGSGGIDLLVSDMNRHPGETVVTLRPLLPLLRPGGALILTLKFHGRSTGRDVTWVRTLEEQLGPDFRIQLLWLLANTQYEQTCIAFKDPLSGPVAAAATEIAALTLAAAAAPAMGVPPGVAVAAT